MAETLSAEVTLLEANPRAMVAVGLLGGRERIAQGNFEIAAADFDADGDEVHVTTLPGNARITSLQLGGDEQDTSANSAVNVGLSRVSATDPSTKTIIDEDYFATATEIFRIGQVRLTELVDESATAALAANWGERLWEIAADTTDTGTSFNITMTQTATVDDATAATLYYLIKYVVD
jgi:hypothetical protein